MRTPVLLLASLVLAACGSDRRAPSSEPGASSMSTRGPDAVLLRVARAGGTVSASVYPRLDSVVWRSRDAAPPIARVIAFDREGGLLAVLDTAGIPVRLDLRLGTVRRASPKPLAQAVSLNGVDIFGVADGAVTRLTPSGAAWSVKVSAPVQALQPQRDGTLLVAATRGGNGIVWRFRPPGTRVSDSVVLATAGRVIDARTSERVFFAAGRALAGVQTRMLQPLQAVTFDAPIRALRATPSGDRFYAALEGESRVAVLDRYSNAVVGAIALPAAASELRMDPLGRYVLARAARGDSAWVIAVGTDKVLGTVHTAWRTDLPLVLPDGALLAAVGDDVAVVDGASLTPTRTIAGGAADLWHLVAWNGFRPRAAGLDKPVEFESTEPTDSVPIDSSAIDSTEVPIDSAGSDVPPIAPPDTTSTPHRPFIETAEAATLGDRRGYTVQFMAAATEREARAELRRLRLPDKVTARIVPGSRNGRPIYRVVAGPFATRAQAKRVGEATNHDYWIFEGAP